MYCADDVSHAAMLAAGAHAVPMARADVPARFMAWKEQGAHTVGLSYRDAQCRMAWKEQGLYLDCIKIRTEIMYLDHR